MNTENTTEDTLAGIFGQKELLPFIEQSQKVTVPVDTTIFRQGDACKNYLLVLSGSVKVFSRAENGREVILYHVREGESCTLTTACLLAANAYPAEGITETEVTALMIPRDAFNQGLAESEYFRKVIFDQYAKRLGDVIALVENLSFGHIDIRLARLLLKLAATSNTIKTTHQNLATELGTAREVVSRQLKAFEKQQLISLQRGSIQILNVDKLKELTEK